VEGPDIAESCTWKFVFSLAKKDQDFQSAVVVVDDQAICSAAGLALPIEEVTIQAIMILRAVGGFLFGYEKPDRCRAFGTKDASVERRIGNAELLA
jgi:hypothetical protein